VAPDGAYDCDRYRKLLAEANDEPKRLALIQLLIDEKAKDRLAAHRLRARYRSWRQSPLRDSVAVQTSASICFAGSTLAFRHFLGKTVAQADGAVEYRTVGG